MIRSFVPSLLMIFSLLTFSEKALSYTPPFEASVRGFYTPDLNLHKISVCSTSSFQAVTESALAAVGLAGKNPINYIFTLFDHAELPGLKEENVHEYLSYMQRGSVLLVMPAI